MLASPACQKLAAPGKFQNLLAEADGLSARELALNPFAPSAWGSMA